MKNTNGGITFLVKLQAYNTKSDTTPVEVCFEFFN